MLATYGGKASACINAQKRKEKKRIKEMKDAETRKG